MTTNPTTTNPTQDRNYYRMHTNDELIDHTKNQTRPTELELVLAERLKHAMRQLEGAYYDRQADRHVYGNQ
jgi:hypothetical protein